MSDSPSGPGWIIKVAKVWTTVTCVSLGVGFVALTTALVLLAVFGQMSLIAAATVWVICLVALPAAGLGAVLTRGVVETAVRSQQGVRDLSDHIKRLESLSEALHESNRQLVDLSRMSDAAKSLVFRQREIEAAEEVLNDYLIRQDYTGAERFVADVQTRLGQAEHAERMRKELVAARETTIEQKVDSALKRINGLLDQQDWDQALRLSHRLMQLKGDTPKVANLPQVIRTAQMKHKLRLLEAYGEAVKKTDIDGSIDLLRELDKYLAPQEAAALEESARGVLRAKLHNLGVQFAMRVTEESWAEALAIGEQIIRGYPNSRMAKEVRDKMDQLTALAGVRAGQ